MGHVRVERVTSGAKGRLLAVLAAAMLGAGVLTATTVTPASPVPAASTGSLSAVVAAVPVTAGAVRDRRPNIVLVSTDDQRLDEMAWMPRTRRLVGGQGVTFDNAISPHPLCCPARAELLTGQYSHNNGVRHNTGRWGGYAAFSREHRRAHLGTWLTRAGYDTAFVGKFLNGYTARHGDQPGWRAWSATLSGTYRYTSFSMRVDGRTKKYSLARNRRHYVADVVGDRGADLVRKFSRSDKPFFLWISHIGPHTARVGDRWVPPIPAPRHRDLFKRSTPPVLSQPNFREADRSDKPAVVRREKAGRVDRVLTSHRQRIRSLQAVDEANARLIRALRDTGELANTIVVFTSDNGYQLGEHRLWSKNWPYESSLRVPLLVRGPGIPAGERRAQVATLVDLPATFLAAAGAPRATTDGVDLLPALTQDLPTTDTTLIQAGAARAPWRWRGVRTPRYTYVRWQSGAEELYDRLTDPFQLDNLLRPDPEAATAASYQPVADELRARFARLADCAGTTCRPELGPMPSPGG